MPLPAVLAAVAPSILGGLGQIFTANKKKKERAFEEELAKMPVYGGAPEIARNYQQALQRANVGLGNLESTKEAKREQARNLNNILSYAASRPGGQGLLSKLYEQQNIGTQRIYAGAEAEKNRRMAELSRAAQMQAADLGKIYASQKEKQGMLASAKQREAIESAGQLQQGFTNLFSGLSNVGRIFAAKGLGSNITGKGEKPFTPKELIDSGALSPISSESLRTSRRLVPDQITDFNMPEGQYEPNLYNILSKRRRGWSM